MKKILLSISLLVFAFNSFAKDINASYAAQVAKHFCLQNNLSTNNHLLYEADRQDAQGLHPVYYVFSAGDHGFVLISGDDLVQPVLAYSNTSTYDVAKLNPSTNKWFDGYKKQIEYVKTNVHVTTSAITAMWNQYYNNLPSQNSSRSTNVVNPLCQTQWNQAPNENQGCPYDNAQSAYCITGCPATAMAQIMRFWSFPTQGTGNHSYAEQHFGTLSADFGAATYNWGGMPYTLSSPNSEVGKLMFHCGVAVEMSYSTNLSAGYVISSRSPGQACCEYAYKTYFGYDPASLSGVERDNFTEQQWVAKLKTDLDAGQPIQYAGFGNGGGHTWVCDGYDANDFFHMNWGWGGNSDGFFSINNLDPASLGAGGGTGGFNSGQQALFGIKPVNGGGGTVNQGSIQLFAATTVSANPFVSGGTFTVNADIANMGASTFTGDLAAAIFNSDGAFVQFIQEYTAQTINASSHVAGAFTSNPLNLIPGVYIIGLYYKNGTNSYSLVAPGSYNNPVSFTVTASYADIQMNGGSALTPGVIVKNQSFSLATQIGNAGASDLTGWISADLYGLDGNWVAAVYETSGTMVAGNAYNITFPCTGLNVAPGSYYIAYTYTTDQTNYALVYTTDFTNKPNPIIVTVTDAPLSPDVYEQNNTEGAAYTLPVNFSGNNATVNTTGSNMHLGNDYDYYKINLPGGTNYSITARVHDTYNSGNGNTYSNDVQFSYNVNGSGYSDAYDDVMSGPIYVGGGGTVTFFVADYFPGNLGTYLLDLQITKNVSGIGNVNTDGLKIFPNPCSSELFVDAGELNGNYTLKFFNVAGAQVKEMKGALTNDLLKADVSELAAGIYTMQLKTNSGLLNSKVVVK